MGAVSRIKIRLVIYLLETTKHRIISLKLSQNTRMKTDLFGSRGVTGIIVDNETGDLISSTERSGLYFTYKSRLAFLTML